MPSRRSVIAIACATVRCFVHKRDLYAEESHHRAYLARTDAPCCSRRIRGLLSSGRHSTAQEDGPRGCSSSARIDEETWFTTISLLGDLESMTAFTKGAPTQVHHLPRDPELLIELPERIEIHRILVDEAPSG